MNMETELTKISDYKEWCRSSFKEFEKSLNGNLKNPLHVLRKEAISYLSDVSFPTTKDENWKYTNISPVISYPFKLYGNTELEKSKISPYVFDYENWNLLVYVNGVYSSLLSKIKNDSSILVSDLSTHDLKWNAIINKYFFKIASKKQEPFTVLNTAFCDHGALVFIPDNKIVQNPLQILNIVTEKGIMMHPRNLIIVGKNSHVQVVESYFSTVDKINYFTNSVNEFCLEENAHLQHYKIQNESEQAFQINSTFIRQEKRSVYTSFNVDLGGKLTRNNISVLLNDEHTETNLYGLFVADNSQQIDNYSEIDHAHPNCFSNEIYKGILNGASKGVFNGKIIVRKDAQKTNAFQQNNNLVLSDDASMNTKPQLEIFADDVKCSHGATIGQLDEETLFYLRSRGLSLDNAKSILQHAFLSDVTSKIKVDIIKQKIDLLILEKFKKTDQQ